MVASILRELRVRTGRRGGRFIWMVTAATVAGAGLSGGACGVFGQQIKLDTAFDRTGTIKSNGTFTSMLDSNLAAVGDEGSNLAIRGIVSISLNPIPDGANVTRVILRVQAFVPFGNPFGDFGTLSVDHVNVVTAINADSFAGGTITAGIATIPTLPQGATRQNVELDVTAQVRADLAAGRPISSFRFLFSQAPTTDTQPDMVVIDAFSTKENMRPSAQATIQ